MITQKVGARRLLKLAEHLERGKLGHKTFDMGTLNSGPRDKKGCGTSGCAIGECPIVFPKYWRFKVEWPFVQLKLASGKGYDTAAVVFFGIDYDVSYRLFHEGRGRTKKQEARIIRDQANRMLNAERNKG